MDNGTYVSLSLATAMRNALDVTANNIANANTAGFKGERVVFDSYMLRETGTEDGRETDFLIDQGSFMDPAQGAMSRTGNPLDLALQGDGWFAYETDGGTAYGRDGRFALSPDGNLVTLNGARVLDPGGAPIALPPDVGGEVTISQDGTISTLAGGVIGRVGLFDLPDAQGYERIGAGMFVPPEGAADTARPASDATRVVQGAIEASNVQPVVEMTRLMAIQQAYERALKLVSSEDDLTRDMLRRIGDTSA
jgi:flagellar basal-body rod protein FlgF